MKSARCRGALWQPPYSSKKVTVVVHWLGKSVAWPSPVDLTSPDALARCLEVLLPYYDVAIRRKPDGDLFLFVDDLGGGFRVR